MKPQLLEQLLGTHMANLTKKGIPPTDIAMERYAKFYAGASIEVIQRQIASNLAEPMSKAEMEERRAERAEAARLKGIQDEENRKRWEAEWEEKVRNFSIDNYDGLKLIKVGEILQAIWLQPTVVSIEDNGNLRLSFAEVDGMEKHLLPNKIYTFNIHIGDSGRMNIWTLEAEQHECYNDGNYGADVVLMYDDGKFCFDLDS